MPGVAATITMPFTPRGPMPASWCWHSLLNIGAHIDPAFNRKNASCMTRHAARGTQPLATRKINPQFSVLRFHSGTSTCYARVPASPTAPHDCQKIGHGKHHMKRLGLLQPTFQMILAQCQRKYAQQQYKLALDGQILLASSPDKKRSKK